MIKVDTIGLGREQDLEDRVELRFLTGMAPYNAGEEAAFEPDYAHKLVSRGIARYLDPSDEPKPETEVAELSEPLANLTDDERKAAAEENRNDEAKPRPKGRKSQN